MNRTDFHKRLYGHALFVVRFVDSLPRDPTTQIISKQLIRSGTSVSANVMEAGAASSKKDYINFYTHALKSANESKFWISLLKDSNKVNFRSVDELLNETIQIANILGASIITMKKNIKNSK